MHFYVVVVVEDVLCTLQNNKMLFAFYPVLIIRPIFMRSVWELKKYKVGIVTQYIQSCFINVISTNSLEIKCNLLFFFKDRHTTPTHTWNLLGPGDHVNQLLIGQVGERHHNVCFSQRPPHVLHEIDLWRLCLYYPLNQLLWSQCGRLGSV